MPPTFPHLPDRIAGLRDVALNLSWSWNHDARHLFRTIDERLWIAARFDALRLLATVSAERLSQCAADPEFLRQYDAVMHWRESEQHDDATWLAREHPELRGKTVAYFCAEFGVYHTVPIYSGGLGVLAGDHCKTASDLGINLVGLGILYREGYFDQRLRLDGWQEDASDRFDARDTPLEPLPGADGAPHIAVVRASGRDVHVRAWRLRVGRVSLILLDTELESNDARDRGLLARLYGGGKTERLRQEWLLGVGGVRVLRSLGYAPDAWHANEGHATFMFIERLRELREQGVPYAEAMQRVRDTSIFTTHTPVPAGHDMFSADAVAECTGPVWEGMGITRDEFMRIGRHPVIDHDTFHMTAAAIRLSRRVNGVSRVHGAVTRRMWVPLWKDRPEDRIPIGHVTNGVHLATWMATPIITILNRHLGQDWGVRAHGSATWDRIMQIDDAEFWNAHVRLKHVLLAVIREEARRHVGQATREAAQVIGSGVLLDPDTLTIGFARRFATYKRADLVFHDIERLLSIVTNTARPVQIVFAGKAHPADTPGKTVLQRVYQATRDPRFQGRVAFVEDYDLYLGHVLVQGVDVWLNLPKVPMEASGTSGMKAALNGVPQISTLDGWWEEGFNGQNGWSIKSSGPDDADAAARELYDILERDVVPTFYDRDLSGMPRRWPTVMKHAIRAAGSRFMGRRMLMEYVRDYYAPAITGVSAADDPPTE